jgi:hypothetical protein
LTNTFSGYGGQSMLSPKFALNSWLVLFNSVVRVKPMKITPIVAPIICEMMIKIPKRKCFALPIETS